MVLTEAEGVEFKVQELPKKRRVLCVYTFICFDLSHMCIYVSMCMFRMLDGIHMEIQGLACEPATYVNTYVYIFPCACVYEWMKYA